MFEHLHTQENEQPRIKTLYAMQNGKPENMFQMSFTKPVTRQEIQKYAEAKWSHIKFKTLRIFQVDAVELFDEDLPFLKDGSRIYISKGDDFDSNRNFGEYQILKDLGEGGFGSVSLAKSRITQEMVAIKVMKPSKTATAKCIDMIFKESEYLKSLSHPNIIKILRCYALKNMRFVVVMEYMQGGELRELLKKKGKFTQEEARGYFKQIAAAVSYCHRQNIVHRDLKLENILLSKDNQVKVTDFGISGMVENFNPEIDWGTLKYMPPQILSKKQRVNAFAGDVWACGIILFYMVEGFLPFTGNSGAQITQKIIHGEVNFSQKNDLSPNCKDLIRLMLEKDPRKRITFFDVESNPWLLKGDEGNIKPSVTNLFSQPVISEKRQPIKIRKLPKQNTLFIPKRLQKEKSMIAQQLEGYKMSRKFYRSQAKGFPSLRSSQQKKTTKIGFQINNSNSKLKLKG